MRPGGGEAEPERRARSSSERRIHKGEWGLALWPERRPRLNQEEILQGATAKRRATTLTEKRPSPRGSGEEER